MYIYIYIYTYTYIHAYIHTYAVSQNGGSLNLVRFLVGLPSTTILKAILRSHHAIGLATSDLSTCIRSAALPLLFPVFSPSTFLQFRLCTPGRFRLSHNRTAFADSFPVFAPWVLWFSCIQTMHVPVYFCPTVGSLNEGFFVHAGNAFSLFCVLFLLVLRPCFAPRGPFALLPDSLMPTDCSRCRQSWPQWCSRGRCLANLFIC